MNAALDYREPYRFSAGMLALTVHLAFFALLYFGVRWQAQPPEEFMVEMWDSLPNTEVAPAPTPEPAPPVKTEPAPVPKVVAPVLPPVKAAIEVPDKKKQKAKEKEAQAKKDLAKEKAVAKAKQEKEQRELDEYVARRMQSERERVRAEVDAAVATQVGKYQDMIRSKIRRNIVMPPDVPETAKAEFKVTLLPGGDVLEVELLKSSGNAAYDNAVERAIYKAQPLPLPSDASLQKMFRELKLTIRP
ncbi:MAG TPA: cell envelope integrity protein TolA [Sideroxyarcus sp.]|nr:cell envelope integrity protein TolA [Sideroxyarcus sp.]